MIFGSRAKFGMADVVRLFGEKLMLSRQFPKIVRRALNDILSCRTSALGGHIDACDHCGAIKVSYNSCGNRNCGKCQSVTREAWVLGREQDLLPVTYYHVVFTIASEMNGLCLKNPALMYDVLFRSAWETLQAFAKDERHLGAKTGATMVLHTWGQNLNLHPHVHAIVPGGGLTKEGKWQAARSRSDRFLFPVKAMGSVFRALFLKKVFNYLAENALALPDGPQFSCPLLLKKWRQGLYKKPWAVYAKRPFGGPKQVIEYLGRYTHKTAISNHRILDVNEKTVRFSYRDYRTGGEKKEMTLAGGEFLRRFTMHILPSGFRRMRHFGILSNANKAGSLAAIRLDLAPGVPVPPKKDRKQLRTEAVERLFKAEPKDRCTCCKVGKMIRIGLVPSQRPPPNGQMPDWSPLATA